MGRRTDRLDQGLCLRRGRRFLRRTGRSRRRRRLRLAIYDAARKLGYGETTTYGELAKRAGQPGLPRETGAALGANPVPLVIPCHRILAAGGKIGGFSAPGGSATKEKMLAMEGVRVGPPPPAQVSFGF
jgi:methylated-DNA-[protein]-cysteine S-methyltransferase